MRFRSKIGLIAILVAFLTVGSFTFALTQTGGQRLFHETGITVEGEFLSFYEQHPHPELVYGFPISVAFTNEDGMLVQYFQRARFELHPEEPEPLRVKLSPLGDMLLQPGEPAGMRKNANACRTFQETGHDVCYSFLDFFDEYGGIAQFGYPITEVVLLDDRFVQYFQRTRFEWHPDSIDSGQEVQLTFLGDRYFREHEDPSLRYPRTTSSDSAPQVLDLRVYAFPVRAVTTPGGMQSIYVIVQDQSFSPVGGAEISLILKYPSGVTEIVPLESTNSLGFTSGEFQIRSDAGETGHVKVDVQAVLDEPILQKDTKATFRITP